MILLALHYMHRPRNRLFGDPKRTEADDYGGKAAVQHTVANFALEASGIGTMAVVTMAAAAADADLYPLPCAFLQYILRNRPAHGVLAGASPELETSRPWLPQKEPSASRSEWATSLRRFVQPYHRVHICADDLGSVRGALSDTMTNLWRTVELRALTVGTVSR